MALASPVVSKVTVLQILLTPVTMGLTLGYLVFSRLELTWQGVALAAAWLLIGRGDTQLLASPAAPARDLPAAAVRADGHLRRVADQGVRARHDEQAGLAHAKRRPHRRRRSSASSLVAEGTSPEMAHERTIPSRPHRSAACASVAASVARCRDPGTGAVVPTRGRARDRRAERPDRSSAKDAEAQARCVAEEDRRLIEIRTVTSLRALAGADWQTPYRLGTPSGYTLVLTPRVGAYTVEDLLELAPQTFLRMSDGVLPAERARRGDPRRRRSACPSRAASRCDSRAGSDGFATIVSLGGELEIVGEETAPVKSQLGRRRGRGRRHDSRGRALYIRAVGGQFVASYVHVSHLGFWSGRTGGSR